MFDFVKKNENKKGSHLKLSSNEMKGLKRYKEGYKDDIKEMNDAIHATVKNYAPEVYKAVGAMRRLDVQFVKQLSDYHTKYIQILGGTSFVKELVPVKHVVNEAMQYSAQYEA